MYTMLKVGRKSIDRNRQHRYVVIKNTVINISIEAQIYFELNNNEN